MQPDLLLRERHDLIREQLRLSGRVLAADLAERFHVSEDTIRRDLRDLAATGVCERVYGGALSLTGGDRSLSERVELQAAQKTALARTAVSFIEPHMTVFLDVGSTNLAIARAIPANANLTIVTNTPLIATALMETSGVSLILVGGQIDRHVGAAIGAKAIRDIGRLRPDLCILGACGVDVEAGLTAVNFDDAEFKRSVAQASRSILVAATNEKLDMASTYNVIPMAECQTLVLEADANTKSVDAFKALGLVVAQAVDHSEQLSRRDDRNYDTKRHRVPGRNC